MKKAKFIVCCAVFSLIFALSSMLCACGLFDGGGNSEEKELKKDGYVLNNDYDWYEKQEENGESGESETYINLTQSEADLNSKYEIGDGQSRVIFTGKSSTTYTNFRIVVSGRYSDLYIELRNFKFDAPVGYAGIDASDMDEDFELTVAAGGTSAVKGGTGMSGSSGKTYDTERFSAEANTPRSGGNGGSGSTGLAAIKANNLFLRTAESSTLTLVGGSGGSGGKGGNGEGGSMPGIGQSGHGGSGGSGGKGGPALEIENALKIGNDGTLKIYGGDGGNGGNGGDGGNNLDTLATDRADHGGNGQNGGNGGSGGNSCKNTFQSSNGGNPGAAGSGGNGGGSGSAIMNADGELFKCKAGKGGSGGKAGKPGYNPSIGYGSSGSNGSQGY